MKFHCFNNNGEEEIWDALQLDFYSDEAHFGVWFDNEEAGWFYVYKDMFENKEKLSDLCGSIDKEVLELMYNRIGTILRKG
jgi:hypothetical protein